MQVNGTEQIPTSIKSLLESFVVVPEAKVRLGCYGGFIPCSSEPEPRTTSIQKFKISKYEITQEQWKAIMGTDVFHHRDKINPQWPTGNIGANYPMVYVTYEDVVEFIQKLNGMTRRNFRLPSADEWEYAARGKADQGNVQIPGTYLIDSMPYYMNFCDINCSNPTWRDSSLNDGHCLSAPVGSYLPNRLGLYDMSGNVQEWTNTMPSFYGKYYEHSRLLMGGCYTYRIEDCRIFDCNESAINESGSTIGFRLVESI